MSKAVLINILMNLVFSALFLFLNNWALQSGLEETFISLALFFGIVVIAGNGLYVYIVEKGGR
jgi:hypothetical protein